MELATNKQKADKLREAIALLMDADAMMQTAMGACDECYETHCAIEYAADDIEDMVIKIRDEE